MENASKALIIAGAILLAILLISLGIMIFTQAQDTVNNNGMSQAELQAFNNKFIKYEGLNKTAGEVKSLINEALTSNADTNNTNRQVRIMFTDTSANLNKIDISDTQKIDTQKKYKVALAYTNGIVSAISITVT